MMVEFFFPNLPLYLLVYVWYGTESRESTVFGVLIQDVPGASIL